MLPRESGIGQAASDETEWVAAIKKRTPRGGGDLTRGEAAAYIAELLDELKTIANYAGLSFVAYLLAMAKDEAQTEKLRDDSGLTPIPGIDQGN